MTSERWQKVKEIFQAALNRAPAEREVFVSDACGGDEELRKEVESLMSSDGRSGTFLDSPAYEAAAEMIVDGKSGLKQGGTLGSYQILSFISRGGMGEVYLAHDPRLSRNVALKILPESFTKDERLRRFEQEARTASALNHPNIITIYEILKTGSTHVIAAEFVEGETLRQCLAHAKLTLAESLHIAIQVADALAAAHKVGIIHRDIKPENIMLRPDGYVKVLDFGLAKLAEGAPNIPIEEALTKQIRTGSGVVIGTAAYMSPEQARGKTVDARSDIFSLGAVIYEMVTGHKPFDGETPSDMLAAILKSEPAPLTEFVADLPSELVRIIHKSLQKDREERYQVIKDLLIDLKSLAQDLEFERRIKQITPAREHTTVPAPNRESAAAASIKTNEATDATTTLISKPSLSSIVKPRRWPTVALVALVIIVAAFGLYEFWARSNEVLAPEVTNVARVTAWPGLDTHPTLAPDGNSVAYSSNHDGAFEIYVKQLTSGGREIQLTHDGQQNFMPAWSPEGQRIAYYSKGRGGIWIIPTFGGTARQLTEFGSAPKWSYDGTMIAFQSDSNPDLGSSSVGSSTIWVIAAQGGLPRPVTVPGKPVGAHLSPTWSPDDRRIAFVDLDFTSQQIWSTGVNGENLKQLSHRSKAGVALPPVWKDPLEGRAAYPLYARDGRSIYFVIGSILWMLPISHDDHDEPTASPIRVTDAGASFMNGLSGSKDGKKIAYGVQTLTSNIWSLAVSPTSHLAVGDPKQLTNQTGARNSQPAFSPDGQKLAFVQFLRGDPLGLWYATANGENATPTTTSGNVPNWFPDGDQIAYVSNKEKRSAVWATSLKKGNEQLIYGLDRDIQFARLSPDGKRLVFNLADAHGINNMWVDSLGGGRPKQLTFDKELAGFGCWSPDGRLIAYQMKRGDDAFLMLMPAEGGEPIQLTSGHGRSWPYGFSPDGDKILFAGERNGIWNVYWFSRSTRQEKQLTNYTRMNAYVRYPSWSPLGTQVAYEYAETTGNIWVLDLK